MTPELKTACEIVFQEHKVSGNPIKWSREAFRGRISIGLSEMAKVELVRKNIIILPNKSKRIITLLNPAVAEAASFEEAEKMIGNKAPVLVAGLADDHPTLIDDQLPDFVKLPSRHSQQLLPINGRSETQSADIKWWLKPLFFYLVWPVCAAVAGALIAFLIDFTYTGLFLDMKY